MTNVFLLDTNSLIYTYQAGGINLLNAYADYSSASGYGLVTTDVVEKELGNFNSADKILDWIDQRGVAVESTPESASYFQAIGGNPPAGYSTKNAGDRSIAEYAQSTISEGGTAAIFSDDAFFTSSQQLKPYGLSPNLNLTNADMLNGAAVTGVIDPDDFSSFKNGFATNANPYNPSNDSYSLRLNQFLSADQLAGEALSAGESPVLLKLLSAGGSLLRLSGVTLLAIDALTTAAKAADDVASGNNLGAEETVASFGGRLAGGIAGAEVFGEAFGGVGLLVGGPIGGAVGGIAGGLIGGVVGATLGQAAVETLWRQITGAGETSSSGSAAPVNPQFQDNSLHVYSDSGLSALQNQMYQAGYSTPQVNYVVQSVEAELSLLRQSNSDATASDALNALAPSVQSQTYNNLGSLDVASENGNDPSNATTIIGAQNNGTAPITTSFFDTSVSTSPFAKVQYTPDPNGNGQYIVTYAGNGETATLSNTAIDPTQLTAGVNGAFTIGSSQPDASGYTNQLSLPATSSFGITGLNVTDPTTGQTSTVALNNGSSTTLQEGRSAATSTPNEQVQTTSADGSQADAIFGQGAQANVSNTAVALETGTQAAVAGNNDHVTDDTTAPVQEGRSVAIDGNGNTYQGQAGDTAQLDGSGNSASNVSNVTLVGDSSSASTTGGSTVQMTASNQTLTADAGSSINVLSGFTNETLSGVQSTVDLGANVTANVVGNSNNVTLDANSGSYVGLQGDGDTLNGFSGSDNANLIGNGSSVTVNGVGGIGMLGSNEAITLDSAGADVGVGDKVSGETIAGSSDTVYLGSSDNVTVQGQDTAVYYGTYTSLQMSGGTVDLAASAIGEGLTGSSDTINLGNNSSGNFYGSSNTIVLNANSNSYAGISGDGDVLRNFSGSDQANLIGDGSSVTVYGTGSIGMMAADETIALENSSAAVGVGSGNGNEKISGTDDTVYTPTGSAVTVQGSDTVVVSGNDVTLHVDGGTVDIANGLSGDVIYADNAQIFEGQNDGVIFAGNNDTLYGASGDDNTYDGFDGGDSSGGGYNGGGGDGGDGGGGYYDFVPNAQALTGGVDAGQIVAYDKSVGATAAAQAAVAGLAQAVLASASTGEAGAATTAVMSGSSWNLAPATDGSRTITWSFAPAGGPVADPISNAIGTPYQATIEKAIQAWADATGLAFTRVADSSPADIEIGFGTFDTASSGVLGFTSTRTSGGALQTALVRLEDPTQSSISTGSDGTLAYSGTNATLYQVALHEIGHALGLADDADPNSVMFAASSASNRTLDLTDLAGAQLLYGTGSQGAATPAVSASAALTASSINRLTQALATFSSQTASETSPSLPIGNEALAQQLAAPLHH